MYACHRAYINPRTPLTTPLIVLVKYVPSWFPGAGFKRFAEDCRRCSDDLSEIPFDFVKDKMVCALLTSNDNLYDISSVPYRPTEMLPNHMSQTCFHTRIWVPTLYTTSNGLRLHSTGVCMSYQLPPYIYNNNSAYHGVL